MVGRNKVLLTGRDLRQTQAQVGAIIGHGWVEVGKGWQKSSIKRPKRVLQVI